MSNFDVNWLRLIKAKEPRVVGADEEGAGVEEMRQRWRYRSGAIVSHCLNWETRCAAARERSDGASGWKLYLVIGDDSSVPHLPPTLICQFPVTRRAGIKKSAGCSTLSIRSSSPNEKFSIFKENYSSVWSLTLATEAQRRVLRIKLTNIRRNFENWQPCAWFLCK